MRHNFKTEFLVCLDLSQDVNYVVGRAPTMEGARDLTRIAKTIFPDDKVYITKEMVLQQNLKQLAPAKTRAVAANPNDKPTADSSKCKCGKKTGQCVGSLNCQCNPIANCKKADKWEANPIEEDEDDVDSLDLEEDFEYEDDEDSEDDEEYASNPEELEEEEFEEDYRDNPDDEDDGEDDDEDGDEDDDDYEDDDEDEDEDEDDED